MELTTLLAASADYIDATKWPTALRVGWILHILGVILWIGGLLFITRVLAHAMKTAGRPGQEAVQESLVSLATRLHHFAMAPGLLLALVGGLMLLMYQIDFLKQPWFHAKLTVALLFIVVHGVLLVKLLGLRHRFPDAKSGVFAALHGISGLLLLAVLIVLRYRF